MPFYVGCYIASAYFHGCPLFWFYNSNFNHNTKCFRTRWSQPSSLSCCSILRGHLSKLELSKPSLIQPIKISWHFAVHYYPLALSFIQTFPKHSDTWLPTVTTIAVKVMLTHDQYPHILLHPVLLLVVLNLEWKLGYMATLIQNRRFRFRFTWPCFVVSS